VEVAPLLLGGYDVVGGGTNCGTWIGWGKDVGRCVPMGGRGGVMNSGGAVGEGNMKIPHMVESMGWSHMWVLDVCVVEYDPWSLSTHEQHAMFQVCLDRRIKDEEHLEGPCIGALIENK
jgi:hypothetical protein